MSIFSGFFKGAAKAAITTATVASGAVGMPDAREYAKNQRRHIAESHKIARENERHFTRSKNRRSSRRR